MVTVTKKWNSSKHVNEIYVCDLTAVCRGDWDWGPCTCMSGRCRGLYCWCSSSVNVLIKWHFYLALPCRSTSFIRHVRQVFLPTSCIVFSQNVYWQETQRQKKHLCVCFVSFTARAGGLGIKESYSYTLWFSLDQTLCRALHLKWTLTKRKSYGWSQQIRHPPLQKKNSPNVSNKEGISWIQHREN